MKVICPECKLKGKAENDYYGRKIRCPDCAAEFILNEKILVLVRAYSDTVENEKHIDNRVTKVKQDKEVVTALGSEMSDKEHSAVETELTELTPPASGIEESLSEELSDTEGRRDDENITTDKAGKNKYRCSSCSTLTNDEDFYRLGEGMYCNNCVPLSSYMKGRKNPSQGKKKGILTTFFKKGKKKGKDGEQVPVSRTVVNKKVNRSSLAILPTSSAKEVCASCSMDITDGDSYKLGEAFYCYQCVPVRIKTA